MTLICFKQTHGVIYVNPEYIRFLYKDGDGTYIDLASKGWATVLEPVEEVLEKLKNIGVNIVC